MAAIDTKLWNLQDMICSLGFTAEDHGATEWREEWYIRDVHGGTGKLRVVVHPDDGYRVEMHRLDRHGWHEWGASFASTPFSVIRASIKAAINA